MSKFRYIVVDLVGGSAPMGINSHDVAMAFCEVDGYTVIDVQENTQVYMDSDGDYRNRSIELTEG